uniref:Uncharacterized protein n=1 Tax=Leersia perrieri TaxID=77586 RepID=A0A0D9WXF8_9ORYZ
MQVPMCFWGDLCRIGASNDYSDTYGRRIIICNNYDYDPPKDFQRGENKQWIDIKQSKEDERYISTRFTRTTNTSSTTIVWSNNRRQKRRKAFQEEMHRMDE